MKRRESPKPEISLDMVTRGARVDLWMTGAVVALALSGCSRSPAEIGTAVVDAVGTDLRDFALAEGGEGSTGTTGSTGGEGGEDSTGTTGSTGGEGGEGGGEGGEGGGEGGEGGGEGGEGGGEGGEGGEGAEAGAGTRSIFVPGALYRLIATKTPVQ